MCGRIVTEFTKEEVIDYFSLDKVLGEVSARYNLGPTQKIPVVKAGSRIMDYYTWGLIPYWSKDKKIGSKLINSRAETILEKKSFSSSFMNKRCLVAVSGFYEWKNGTPNYITLKDKKIFALAGIYSIWTEPKTNEEIKTVSIITCKANSFMEKIHERMPVIIEEDNFGYYIDPKNKEIEKILQLLTPYDSNKMKNWIVKKDVNKISMDTKELIKEVSDKQRKLF